MTIKEREFREKDFHLTFLRHLKEIVESPESRKKSISDNNLVNFNINLAFNLLPPPPFQGWTLTNTSRFNAFTMEALGRTAPHYINLTALEDSAGNVVAQEPIEAHQSTRTLLIPEIRDSLDPNRPLVDLAEKIQSKIDALSAQIDEIDEQPETTAPLPSPKRNRFSFEFTQPPRVQAAITEEISSPTPMQ